MKKNLLGDTENQFKHHIILQKGLPIELIQKKTNCSFERLTLVYPLRERNPNKDKVKREF